MKVTAGEYRKFYDPSAGENEPWYINDHCIIKGEDGWHLFGITHAEPAVPLDELCCAHAVGTSLSDSAWKKQPFPIVTDRNRKEAHFWAPHVIRHNGRYHMFWCAGSTEGNTKYRIMTAVSDDLYHWERLDEVNPVVVDGFDARDPMVMEKDTIREYQSKSSEARKEIKQLEKEYLKSLNNSNEGDSNNGCLIFGLIALVLILIGLCVYLFFFK